jgi:hypothetical protein
MCFPPILVKVLVKVPLKVRLKVLVKAALPGPGGHYSRGPQAGGMAFFPGAR